MTVSESMRFDIGCINALLLWFQIGSFKTNFLQQLFHDRLQSASADVFGVLIYLSGKVRNRIDRVVVKSIVTSSVAIIA